MKHLKTLITLFLLLIGTGLSWADVVCTWDFTDPNSEASNANFEHGGVETGSIASDVNGVNLYVDASIANAKFNSAERSSDVQINAGTVIMIPVKTNKDKIVITNYSDKRYRMSFSIGSEEVGKVKEYEYSVTDGEATNGYAEMKVLSDGYALKIAVTHCDIAPSSAEERTATWDFTKIAKDDVNINGSVGSVASDIDGVALNVDASNGGKFWARGTDAQFNGGAIINVPVRHVGDIVTIVSHPNYHNYTIAGSAATNDTEAYTATEADVANKSVSIVASSSVDAYVWSISVKQIAYSDPTEPEEEQEGVEAITAIWHWKKAADGSNIVVDTNIKGKIGYVRSDIETLSLEVDASINKDAAFVMENAGNVKVAHLSKGCTIRVPVRRGGDVITVSCGKGQDNYSIGGAGNVASYTATPKDAEKGYVEIYAEDDTRFWEITVLQGAFQSVLPMIKFNSAGWASFTSLVKDYVVYLPKTAQAYVATAVDYEDSKGTVTLTPVDRFTYGEGVFVRGIPNADVYAKITTKDVSNVPKPTGNVRTEGCLKDLPLYDDSDAFVIATKNTGDKPVAGFYRVMDTVTVPAGKAYLYVKDSGAAKSLSFKFDDGSEATGIESIVAGVETKDATVFYNLAGQVVGKDYKGIVVGNDGKKYVK